jgi:predicted TIM-barrel fold metal-dependent hydrolase
MLNFTLSTEERIKMHLKLARVYESWARASGDDENGKRKWTEQAVKERDKAEELKGVS